MFVFSSDWTWFSHFTTTVLLTTLFQFVTASFLFFQFQWQISLSVHQRFLNFWSLIQIFLKLVKTSWKQIQSNASIGFVAELNTGSQVSTTFYGIFLHIIVFIYFDSFIARPTRRPHFCGLLICLTNDSSIHCSFHPGFKRQIPSGPLSPIVRLASVQKEFRTGSHRPPLPRLWKWQPPQQL